MRATHGATWLRPDHACAITSLALRVLILHVEIGNGPADIALSETHVYFGDASDKAIRQIAK